MNKLLPLKVAVRLLASQASESNGVVPFEAFRIEAAMKARAVGSRLRRNDARAKRRWDERLSSGFPIGEDEGSSLNRYAGQFVGHRRKRDGEVSGGLFDMRFGNIEVIGGESYLGLTGAGLDFARLANPVLDLSDFSCPLGEEEVDFYLQHIRARVPGEVFAFELILNLIVQGVDGREGLNRSIADAGHLDWPESVVNTQRAGAMARMYDLGLLDKARDGVAVKYHATPRGLEFLGLSGTVSQ
jgi:hypothetical protein